MFYSLMVILIKLQLFCINLVIFDYSIYSFCNVIINGADTKETSSAVSKLCVAVQFTEKLNLNLGST